MSSSKIKRNRGDNSFSFSILLLTDNASTLNIEERHYVCNLDGMYIFNLDGKEHNEIGLKPKQFPYGN